MDSDLENVAAMPASDDLEAMIEDSGVSIPLAARFLAVSREAGASQIEILTAMEILKAVLDVSKTPVFARGVGHPLLNPLAREE